MGPHSQLVDTSAITPHLILATDGHRESTGAAMWHMSIGSRRFRAIMLYLKRRFHLIGLASPVSLPSKASCPRVPFCRPPFRLSVLLSPIFSLSGPLGESFAIFDCLCPISTSRWASTLSQFICSLLPESAIHGKFQGPWKGETVEGEFQKGKVKGPQDSGQGEYWAEDLRSWGVPIHTRSRGFDLYPGFISIPEEFDLELPGPDARVNSLPPG